MKPSNCPRTGDMPEGSPNLDGGPGHATRPADRCAWQTPRLYHLDVGTDTEFHAIGLKIDGNTFLS